MRTTMSNQQEFLAIAIPSFLILVGFLVNFQGYKAMSDRFSELSRKVEAETSALRQVDYEHVQRIRTLEVKGEK